MSQSFRIDPPSWLPDAVPRSAVKLDFTAATVPQDIKNKVIKNSILFVDVVNAGPKAGTGLEENEATDLGLIKNHWAFRGHIDLSEDGQQDDGQVYFGMDAVVRDGVGSNEGQYARSSNRSSLNSGSNVTYSSIGSSIAPAQIIQK